MTVTIYHNPRCSKSRETLALLEAKGVKPEIVHYLQTPPSKAQIKTLAQQLGLNSVREMMRTKEDIYGELGLADASEAALIAAMEKQGCNTLAPLVGRRAGEWSERKLTA